MSYFDTADGVTPNPSESSTDTMDTPAPDTGGFRRFASRPSARCPECGRTFDLADPDDADEHAYGHDCEAGAVRVEFVAYAVAVAAGLVPVGLAVAFVASLVGAIVGTLG